MDARVRECDKKIEHPHDASFPTYSIMLMFNIIHYQRVEEKEKSNLYFTESNTPSSLIARKLDLTPKFGK